MPQRPPRVLNRLTGTESREVQSEKRRRYLLFVNERAARREAERRYCARRAHVIAIRVRRVRIRAQLSSGRPAPRRRCRHTSTRAPDPDLPEPPPGGFGRLAELAAALTSAQVPPHVARFARGAGITLDEVWWCHRCGIVAFAADDFQRDQLTRLGWANGLCPLCREAQR